MKTKRKRIGMLAFIVMIAVLMIVTMQTPGTIADPENYQCQTYATVFALLPPVIAIGLALITKEVYTSLLAGIIAGGLLYSNFNLELMLNTIFYQGEGGMVMKLSDSWNVGILVFLVMLGILVALLNKAGGSAAFGEWTTKHIKTRVGAQIAVIALGVMIFVDDYFNCLTVGSVMRPVTDRHQVSRAKLAYIIDATAAPVCIIAPISSWAAAVTSSVPEEAGINGFSVFIQTIPYNLYAILTLCMLLAVTILKVNFGPMKKHEMNAFKGDLFTTSNRPYADAEKNENVIAPKGKVIDLLIPILSLIVCCVIGMLYTGGFFSGVDFVTAFSQSDASLGLCMGSFFGLVITVVLYVVRHVMSFNECMGCIPQGFKAMVPAILILTFAWTLKGMTDSLGAAEFVAEVVKNSAKGMMNLLPAVIFLVGCALAFATGTSWGTFGILIPIVVEAFQNTNPTLMTISISACMAGAVCGDHCSPISDTTIMASAGAQSDHVNHVSTQLPYALSIAVISCITYIIAGFTQSAWISLPAGIVMTVVFLIFMKMKMPKEDTNI